MRITIQCKDAKDYVDTEKIVRTKFASAHIHSWFSPCSGFRMVVDLGSKLEGAFRSLMRMNEKFYRKVLKVEVPERPAY